MICNISRLRLCEIIRFTIEPGVEFVYVKLYQIYISDMYSYKTLEFTTLM